MVDRVFAVVEHQVLLAHIGDVAALRILGEQMVKGLVLGRAQRLRDRLVPFFAIGEFGIDIEHHSAEVEEAVADHVADRETREAAGQFDFRPWWFIPGLVIAAGIHTLFNQFPDRPLLAMLGAAMFAPLAIIAIFNFGTSEAQKWLETEYAGHQALLEILRSGKWPAGPTTARLEELARRLGPEGEAQLRRYSVLLAGLVVEAEETMIEQAAGKVVIDKVQVAADFAELDALDRSLGRLTSQALKRLLPFSHNDYWELSELRQRVSRK